MTKFKKGDKIKFKQEMIDWVENHFVANQTWRPRFEGVNREMVGLNDEGHMNKYINSSTVFTVEDPQYGYLRVRVEEDMDWVWDEEWFELYHSELEEAEDL